MIAKNKARAGILLCGLLAGIAAVVALYWWPAQPLPEAKYDEQRVIRVVYQIANQTNKAIQNASFSTYLPVKQLSNQRALPVKASRDFHELRGEFGNRVGEFDLGLLPPFGKKQLNLTLIVDMAKTPNTLVLNNPEYFLKSEPFIEADHPSVTSLAESLQGDSEQQTLQNIFNWVSQQVQYVGYVPDDKGALYAIENKRGDCTEYSYAVAALARASGIPARVIGGYVYDRNRVAKASDYHNWTEVYIDGRWQLIDAQNKTFMTDAQNYIALRILTNSDNSLLGSSHRFLLAQEGLSVKLL